MQTETNSDESKLNSTNDEDIISCTPTDSPSKTTISHKRKQQVFNKTTITHLSYYPDELERPKHPSAFDPPNLDKNQAEVYFLRMICEVTALNKNEKFRFANLRTVGTYNIFKNLDHIKDTVTGHRIELDFSDQFYNKKPEILSIVMVMGTIKYKTIKVKDGIEKIFVPYIFVKTWEGWSGRINFQQFYYNARRYRNPQVDETIPVEDEELETSDDDDDLSQNEEFEKTAFFDKLTNDGLLTSNTTIVNTSNENLFDDSL